jgi:hypothetical protein
MVTSSDQLSSYRVSHRDNGPADVFLGDRDHTILLCYQLSSSGTRPVELGHGARMASIEVSKSALRVWHGLANGQGSPS